MKNYEEFILSRILRSLQKQKQHIAISLTENCPLACEHCIVSAKKGSFDRSDKTLQIAHWVINGLSINASRISAISFTGGESPLADTAFRLIGDHALSLGIPCGLVTSGYWGKTESTADKFIRKYNFLKQITLSIDEYHVKYLDISYPLNCVAAAQANGISSSVRYSGRKDSDFYKSIQNSLVIRGLNPRMEHQPIVLGGRATGLSDIPSEGSVLSQCLSDGPHISAKGNILPCCSNIVSSDTNIVLGLGDIFKTSFEGMLDSFEKHRALQIIRTWGWDHIVDNVPELAARKKSLSCKGGCEQCAMITLDAQLASAINSWLETDSATLSYEKAIDTIRQIRGTSSLLGESNV